MDLKEFIIKNPSFHRQQGIPPMIELRKAVAVLAAKAGTDANALAKEYDSALSSVHEKAIAEEEKRIKDKREAEAQFAETVRTWLLQHVTFAGDHSVCKKVDVKDPSFSKPCGGEVDVYHSIVQRLVQTCKIEDPKKFTEGNRETLDKYLATIQALTGKCKKCGRSSEILREAIRIK